MQKAMKPVIKPKGPGDQLDPVAVAYTGGFGGSKVHGRGAVTGSRPQRASGSFGCRTDSVGAFALIVKKKGAAFKFRNTFC
jgi:hypothetical protein